MSDQEFQEISYGIAESNLGWVIIAASKNGINTIALGDTSEELVRLIHQRFPQANPCNIPTFQQWVRDILTMIEVPQRGLSLPLDMQGTTFQQRVWRVLQSIPVGSTLSYQQVAQQIGNPKAVRAVASACAANNLAIVVPCHRVIGSDGSLSGYRWGVERKRALLELEKQL